MVRAREARAARFVFRRPNLIHTQTQTRRTPNFFFSKTSQRRTGCSSLCCASASNAARPRKCAHLAPRRRAANLGILQLGLGAARRKQHAHRVCRRRASRRRRVLTRRRRRGRGRVHRYSQFIVGFVHGWHAELPFRRGGPDPGLRKSPPPDAGLLENASTINKEQQY